MQRPHTFAALALALALALAFCADLAVAQDLVPTQRMAPAYPLSAARNGISGWVEVRFVINRDGTVRTAQVLRSEPKYVFDQAALNAIINWRFKPVAYEGMAGVQRFNFEPPQPPQPPQPPPAEPALEPQQPAPAPAPEPQP